RIRAILGCAAQACPDARRQFTRSWAASPVRGHRLLALASLAQRDRYSSPHNASKGQPIAGGMLDVRLTGLSPPAPTLSPYNTSIRVFPEDPWWDTSSPSKKFLSLEQVDFTGTQSQSNF